jgi:hypothetical protein
LSLSKLLVGRSYTIQTSSDLAAWQDAYSFSATVGTNQWTDTVSSGTSRFYRLAWKR